MINRKIKSVFKYILFLSIFFFLLELLARFFFPAFQANNIFYDIDKNYRISKGVHTYFNTYNGVTFRVQEYLERIKINKKKSVWFVGDSVTNGYGMTFNETYHSIFQDLINASEKKINTYAISSYGSDLKKSFDDFGVNTIGSKPQDFEKFVGEDIELQRQLFKQANIQAQ